jgi:hypothetical protein
MSMHKINGSLKLRVNARLCFRCKLNVKYNSSGPRTILLSVFKPFWQSFNISVLIGVKNAVLSQNGVK